MNACSMSLQWCVNWTYIRVTDWLCCWEKFLSIMCFGKSLFIKNINIFIYNDRFIGLTSSVKIFESCRNDRLCFYCFFHTWSRSALLLAFVLRFVWTYTAAWKNWFHNELNYVTKYFENWIIFNKWFTLKWCFCFE